MNIPYALIKKADAGDAEAQWSVAWDIVFGDQKSEIEPDLLERAIEFFKRSAEQGNGDAMCDLGAMYNYGRGVEQNEAEAVQWYKKAAEILHPKAFRCLGHTLGFHNFRDGGYADYKKAFSYYLKGALLGEQDSLGCLGDMYFYGNYVAVDQVFAFNLFQESEDIINDNVYDDCYAIVCVRIGECLYKFNNSDKSNKLSIKYLQNAINSFEYRIEKGDPPEYYMNHYHKAKRLLDDIDSRKSPITADERDSDDFLEFIKSDYLKYPKPKHPIIELDCLLNENIKLEDWDNQGFFNEELAAAKSGSADAMYHVAFYCFNRYSRKESFSQNMINFALYYYHKAARSGRKSAMYNLGAIYAHGEGGVEVDHKKALLLYTHSNTQLGQGELGVYYAKGESVEQSYEKAFKCFAKSALHLNNSSYGSLGNLAIMYRNGLYVDVDHKFADYCDTLRKKAEKGFNSNPVGKIVLK